MLQLAAAEQRAALFEHGDDDGIRLPHVQAVEGGRRGKGPGGGIDVNVAAGVDAAGGVEAVALAGVEVVGAVGGRGVDGAGAGVGGDVGGQHAQDAALQEGMLEGDAVEHGAFEAGDLSGRAEFAGGGHLRGQCRGDDVDG